MSIQIKGLQYFPVNVDFFEEDIVFILSSDFGVESSAVLLRLISKIYKNGYYLEWNDKVCKIFAATFHSKYTAKDIQAIVACLANENFFDKAMYEKYHILTSKPIQECFFTATQRRKNKDRSGLKYLLIDNETDNKNIVDISAENVDILPKNVAKKGENVDIPKQSKVKESKVNNLLLSSSSCAREEKLEYGFKPSCDAWHQELLTDEEWLHSVAQCSGKGSAIVRRIPEIFPHFEAHIIASGETGTIRHINDYKRRFVNWWRCMNFETGEQILARGQMKNGKPGISGNPKKSKIDEAMECARVASVNALKLFRMESYGTVD